MPYTGALMSALYLFRYGWRSGSKIVSDLLERCSHRWKDMAMIKRASRACTGLYNVLKWFYFYKQDLLTLTDGIPTS